MAAMTELPDTTQAPAAGRRLRPSPLETFPVRWSGRAAVIRIPASLDDAAADQLRDALLAIIDRGVEVLVIDLSATVSLASAGAWAIVRAQRRAAAAQAQIQIVPPSAYQVLRLLEQASLA